MIGSGRIGGTGSGWNGIGIGGGGKSGSRGGLGGSRGGGSIGSSRGGFAPPFDISVASLL